MIAFLTICYLVVLFILIKMKVIQPTLWWKLSPLVWVVSLFIILFMPMQWGAPGGTTNTYQYVVEIVPNVVLVLPWNITSEYRLNLMEKLKK